MKLLLKLSDFHSRNKSHIPPKKAKIKRADSANLKGTSTIKLFSGDSNVLRNVRQPF